MVLIFNLLYIQALLLLFAMQFKNNIRFIKTTFVYKLGSRYRGTYNGHIGLHFVLKQVPKKLDL